MQQVIRGKSLDRLRKHFPLDTGPLGTSEEELKGDLDLIFKENREQYNITVALLVILFTVLVVLTLVLQNNYARAAAALGGGVTAGWCIRRMESLGREWTALQLLARMAARDPDAAREFVAVLRQWAAGGKSKAASSERADGKRTSG